MKIIKIMTFIFLTLFLINKIQAADNSNINLEAIKLLSRAFTLIKRNLINEVSETELLDHCISGMASGADPESSYLSKEKFQELRTGYKIATAGIGLVLTIKNGYPIVISPIDGTPAYIAGLKSGDMIMRIEKKDTRGKRLETIITELRGAPDSTIQLKIINKNKAKIRVINLKRKIIRVNSVKARLLKNKTGYIRITSFLSNTANKLKSNIAMLTKQVDGRLNGLILDLRNNPGGLLSSAIDVADTFLDSGLITYSETRYADSEIKYVAHSTELIADVPVVVLVNEGTASASEVVSAALRYHKRATILGTKTFGRSSIQTVMPLADGSALKLTTARWMTPSGAIIHGKGIKPDVIVKQKPDAVHDYQLTRALSYFNEQ